MPAMHAVEAPNRDGPFSSNELVRPPRRDDGEGPTRRVSLRSSVDELDVSAIARTFGGGGHPQAAGFSSDATIDEITETIRLGFLAQRAASRA